MHSYARIYVTGFAVDTDFTSDDMLQRVDARMRLIQYMCKAARRGMVVAGRRRESMARGRSHKVASILLTESPTLSRVRWVIILGDHIARVLTNSGAERESSPPPPLAAILSSFLCVTVRSLALPSPHVSRVPRFISRYPL